MTLQKCLELINILKSQIADPNTSVQDKEFNKEWIKQLCNSISISFSKSIKKSEKKHNKIFK